MEFRVFDQINGQWVSCPNLIAMKVELKKKADAFLKQVPPSVVTITIDGNGNEVWTPVEIKSQLSAGVA